MTHMCANCGRPIRQRDNGGIWVHDESGTGICTWAEPDTEPTEQEKS